MLLKLENPALKLLSMEQPIDSSRLRSRLSELSQNLRNKALPSDCSVSMEHRADSNSSLLDLMCVFIESICSTSIEETSGCETGVTLLLSSSVSSFARAAKLFVWVETVWIGDSMADTFFADLVVARPFGLRLVESEDAEIDVALSFLERILSFLCFAWDGMVGKNKAMIGVAGED